MYLAKFFALMLIVYIRGDVKGVGRLLDEIDYFMGWWYTPEWGGTSDLFRPPRGEGFCEVIVYVEIWIEIGEDCKPFRSKGLLMCVSERKFLDDC